MLLNKYLPYYDYGQKKNLKDSAPSSSANLVELDKKKLSISDSDNEKLMTNQFVQLSPNSLDESASEALATTDYETRGVKRRSCLLMILSTPHPTQCTMGLVVILQ